MSTDTVATLPPLSEPFKAAIWDLNPFEADQMIRQTNMRIPDNLRRALHTLALADNRTEVDVYREAIRFYVHHRLTT